MTKQHPATDLQMISVDQIAVLIAQGDNPSTAGVSESLRCFAQCACHSGEPCTSLTIFMPPSVRASLRAP